MEALRAAIVSGDPLARSALAALLAGRADVAAVSSTGTGPGTPPEADVVLVDVGATERGVLRELASSFPVVALVDGADEAADALAAGARAVVFRDAGPERLAAALVAAAQGLVAVDRALASWLRPPAPPGAAAAEGLTPREVEVLALLAEGLTNKAIAGRLGISERTAKFHVESILAKLGAESRSEAIVLAARRGMITL